MTYDDIMTTESEDESSPGSYWGNEGLRRAYAQSSLMKVNDQKFRNIFGPTQLKKIMQSVRNQGAGTLFVNSLLSFKQIETLADELNKMKAQNKGGNGDLDEKEEEEEIQVVDRFLLLLRIFFKYSTDPIVRLKVCFAYSQFLRSLAKRGEVLDNPLTFMDYELLK